jgi:hypothetical protein
MPCNLAISIAKARVAAGRLAALLRPEQVAALLDAYARQRWGRASTDQRGGVVTVAARAAFGRDRLTIRVAAGQVETESDYYTRSQLAEIGAQVAELLDVAGGRVLDQEIVAALSGLGRVTSQAVEVEDEGRVRPATHIRLHL